MKTISVRESVSFGWETFKKRPLFFMGAVLVIAVISGILSSITDGKSAGAMAFLLGLAVVIVNVFIEMGLVSFALKAERDTASLTLKDLWHPTSFLYYAAAKILTGIIVIIGLVLLIVPGVIAALSLVFATYLIIDRNMKPIDAMKESVRMTKGHRWELFVLALALLGLNILGALAVMVGLLVSVPVSLFTLAHVYRTLSHAGTPTAV